MSIKKFKIIIGFVLVVFTSCVDEKKTTITNPLYYDMPTLVDRQISLLDSINPSVVKELTIGGKKEKKTLKNLNWKKELDIFKEIDINSPVLRDKYSVKEESAGRGTRISYTRKDVSSKGIASLIVDYDEKKNIKNINCVVVSDNLLFFSQRKLSLGFVPSSNGEVLKNYTIINKRNLLFKDKEESILKVDINLPL